MCLFSPLSFLSHCAACSSSAVAQAAAAVHYPKLPRRTGVAGGCLWQAALGQIGVQQLGSCLLSPYGTRALLATVRHMKIPYFDSWRGKRIRRCLQSKTDNGSYSPTHTPTTYSHMLSHRVPQFNLGKFQLIHSLTHAQAYFYLCGESLR